MPVRIVQSKQNARLKELRRALRSPDKDAGLIAIEGPNLVNEALRAGIRVRTIFTSDGSFLESLDQAQSFRAPSSRLLSGARVGDHESSATCSLPPQPVRDAEVLLFPRDVLIAALETETPQPVAALVEPPEWIWTDLLESEPALVVILAGLQDPGNLGTILRSAEAFGANGIVALPGTVSPWNQKAMRASAGSVFRLPVIEASVDECFTQLRGAGARILTTAVKDAEPIDSVDFSQPTALLIGNEGNGVSAEIAVRADGTVTIPCPGPVESLNASVAASILLYEAARQRRMPAQSRGRRL